MVIGSMAPDFGYFEHLAQQGRAAHEFPGVVLYTFPVAVLIFLFFHLVFKWPVLCLLPVGMQKKLVAPARHFDYRNRSQLCFAVLSLWIGIASHLVWDSFTHQDGWVVLHLPIMLVPLFHVGRTAITGFKIAQHGSTLAGLVILLLTLVRWYRRAPVCEFEPPLRLRGIVRAAILGAVAVTACAAALARGMAAAPRIADLPELRMFVSTMVVTSITLGSLELAAFALAVHFVVLPLRRARL